MIGGLGVEARDGGGAAGLLGAVASDGGGAVGLAGSIKRGQQHRLGYC